MAPITTVVETSPSPNGVLPHGPDAVPGVEGLPPVATQQEPRLNRSEFGIDSLKAGQFEYTPELRTSYQNSAENMAAQMKQYRATGGELSEAQKKFLELYSKNPEQLLNTAEGWITTHLMLEQEMFIRGAIVEQDLQLLVKEKGKQPTVDNKVTILKEEFDRGILNKYGPKALLALGAVAAFPTTIPAFVAYKAWRSAATYNSREITLELGTQTVDTNSLSEQDRNYIEYLRGKTTPENTGQFLLQAGVSQQEFYKQLGVDIAKIEGGGSSWSRFVGAANVLETKQGVNTGWEAYRVQQVGRIVADKFGGIFPHTSRERALLYSEAQQATIEHFASQALGATVEKGAAPSAETSSSITVMEQRAAKLKDPEEAQKFRVQKQAELAQSETQMIALVGSIREAEGYIENLTKEIDINNQKITGYPAEITARNTVIGQLQGDISTIEALRTTAITTFEAQVSATPDPKDKANIQAAKDIQVQKYTQQIDQIKVRMQTITAEIEARQKQINESIVKGAEKTIYENRLIKFQSDKSKLEKAIKKLKKAIEQPIGADALEKAEQLVMTAESLKRHENIISSIQGSENSLTLQALTDRTPASTTHQKFNSPVEAGKEVGYLVTLDHLFQYSKAADPKKAFETAQRVLSRDSLVAIIEDYLDLPAVPAAGIPRTLQDALRELHDKNKTPSQLSGLFTNIMDNIESRGLRTI